jgi:anti-sigma factor (TIGR02949 family)
MAPVIGCRDAVERMWAYLDGDLGEADHRSVEEHLVFCLRCCGELEFAREVRQVLATRSAVALPEDVQHRLEELIDRLDAPGDRGATSI